MPDHPSRDQRFIDERSQQLRDLERLLIGGRHGVVNLHGAPGSGKTAVASLFAANRQADFPGGTLVLAAHGDLSVHKGAIDGLGSDAPALVVLDDVQYAWFDSIRELFDYISEERPLTRVLMTSNIPISVNAATWAVEMPALPLESVIGLLAQQTNIEPGRLQQLGALLEGNASAVEAASRRLASGMPPERIIEWFESRALVVARDADGRPLDQGTQGRRALEAAVSEISEELIASLVAKPELLYELDPRKFEKLVAELYRRRGFETTLTPASGDEGADVYVVKHDELGRTLWVVQAKRWAANRKIGAGVVRELYGTVEAKNASAGVLVTTSFFEPGAERMERELRYRLSLRDYLGLQEMLQWPRD